MNSLEAEATASDTDRVVRSFSLWRLGLAVGARRTGRQTQEGEREREMGARVGQGRTRKHKHTHTRGDLRDFWKLLS